MSQPPNAPLAADADAIVDALLTEPGRADEIRDLLRQSLPVTSRKRVQNNCQIAPQSEADDLWDNMPV